MSNTRENMVVRGTASRWPSRPGLWCFALALLLLPAPAWAAVTWKIKITPAHSGLVVWATSSPVASGQLATSGSISFNENAMVDLTFTPNDGFERVAVYKNTTDWTAYLDVNGHYQFGPVGGAHTILAVFAEKTPTGTFGVSFPADPPASLASVYDLTGHYEGVSPTPHQRAYSFDLAQDESGKIMGLGTIAGMPSNQADGKISVAGSVKTQQDEPRASLVSTCTGTRDGEDASCRATASGPVDLQDIGDGLLGAEGEVDYTARVAGVPFQDRDVPVAIPASPDISRAWSVAFTIAKRTIGSPTRPVSKLYGSAELILPNGDHVQFAERPVSYSRRQGYNLTFTRGQNITAGRPDTKSKIMARKMTLTETGDGWEVQGGDLMYWFLGQRGKGRLSDFTQVGR